VFATATYVPCAQSLETQQLHAQVDAPVEAPTTETYAMARWQSRMTVQARVRTGRGEGEGKGKGKGKGDEEDQTEPEPEAEAKEDEDVGWMT
jgi:hypothetical protein